MKKQIFVTFCLIAATMASAAKTKVVTDNSMSAEDRTDIEYTDRGSFGPFIEFSNVKMDNVNYSYKVHELPQEISISNTYIYGATGTLPVTEWFDIFLMAGYQHIGVSHKPRNDKAAYDDLAEIVDLYGEEDAPIDSSTLKGHHNIHTALFQFGADLSYPIFTSYKYQLMVKPYAFAGVIVGKTFFTDNAKFVSPVAYGYAYGAGVRCAFHGFFLSGGVRSSHEYFHTYFERRLSSTKSGDEFMLDFDTYFQPYLTLGITLF